MSEQVIQKSEHHITILPKEINHDLAIALGEMVVAFGRLEDMFKVAIKRMEHRERLDEVIKEFSGGGGTLGQLISYCIAHIPNLKEACKIGQKLNTDRHDFIHATFAASEEGGYVRFRELTGYMDLAQDITQITEITREANSLIERLDEETGSLVASPARADHTIARYQHRSHGFETRSSVQAQLPTERALRFPPTLSCEWKADRT